VRWLGFAVLGGVLTSMLALGAIISALQIAVGEALVVVSPLADLVVIGLGAALFFGANPFARLPVLSVGSSVGSPSLSAYVYGLLYGPIALPCSGPLLIGIFTLSLSVGSLAEKLVFFLLFGLGFGVPLFLIALAAQGWQATLLRLFARHYAVFSRLAGIVLVAAGAWDLSVNLPFVLLYLGL
jgi:cytochrome c-type biogenesis protein